MGKTVQVVPAAQRLNERMLGNDRAALGAIASSQQKIAAMRANPDFQHAENTARLDALSEKLGTQKAALEEEIAAREELRDALVAKDKDAAAKARGKLKAIRAGHAKDYGKGESVVVCQECIDRKLHAIRKVRTPATPEAMTDLVTGVFEGSEPDYCKIADSPTDNGGLSYGKHQAAEKKGGLHQLLTAYVHQGNPAAAPLAKAGIQAHLVKFSAAHDRYTGSASDRAAFKSALQSACKDPAMQRAQDKFFADNYMLPANASADELCVHSNLGRAMLYDLSIQSGPGRIETLAPRAMKRLGKPADASCRPCDPNGPDEASFLQALNEERRSYVTSLGGDAADSTYREDFFADMLEAGNTDMQNDFVIRGIPVKGLPAPVPPVPSPP